MELQLPTALNMSLTIYPNADKPAWAVAKPDGTQTMPDNKVESRQRPPSPPLTMRARIVREDFKKGGMPMKNRWTWISQFNWPYRRFGGVMFP